MIKNFFNFSLICSVFIGFFFILFTLLSKRGRDKSLIYLNLVVLFFTLNNLQIVLLDNVFYGANFFIRNLLIPFYVLIVPAFYTFITYYLNVEKKIRSYVIFSSVVFISEIAIRALLFQNYYDDDKNYLVARYSQIEEIFNALFTLFIFIKSIILLFNKSKLYEYILTYDTIGWLKKFVFIGCVIIITWITAIVSNLDKVINPQIFIYYPLRLSTSLLLFWLGYQGFFNYSLLSERIQLRKKNSSTTIESTIENKTDKFAVVKKYIQDNKCFLNPEISLEIIADELKMSTSSLSQIINQNSNYNFSDYINALRVEKSKLLLTDSEFKEYTILSIGLECGFNSKSTFYTAFKKFTQTTPTEFQKANS